MSSIVENPAIEKLRPIAPQAAALCKWLAWAMAAVFMAKPIAELLASMLSGSSVLKLLCASMTLVWLWVALLCGKRAGFLEYAIILRPCALISSAAMPVMLLMLQLGLHSILWLSAVTLWVSTLVFMVALCLSLKSLAKSFKVLHNLMFWAYLFCISTLVSAVSPLFNIALSDNSILDLLSLLMALAPWTLAVSLIRCLALLSRRLAELSGVPGYGP